MKILVVEDEAMVAHAIEILLSEHHYSVDIAVDGLAALEMAEVYTYDLLLLDIGLPQLDGISLCQQLRAQGIQTPILLLTGQATAAHNRAIALNAGADDYVTKPFETEELLARVRALLRRGDLKTQPILRWGTLWLDPSRLQVSYGDTLLHLTPKEYSLLELLLRHAPNIISSYSILEQCWNALEAPGDEVVRTHIKELRKKLKAAGAPKDLIKTVHRQGYRLNPLYGDVVGATQGESATALQAAELRAINEELRQTLEQLQATQSLLEQRNQDLQAVRDELEQRVAERTATLHQREAFLHSIYEGTEQPIFVVAVTETGDFRYVSHNRASQEVTGVSLEAFQDQTPEAVFGPALGAQFRQNYERCVQANHSIVYEDHFVFHDRPHWTLTTLAPLYDATGRLDRLVGTTLDVSDRKQAEAALRQSEEHLRLFVTASSDAVYCVSADWQQMYLLEGKDFLVSTAAPCENWMETYIPPAEQARVWAAIHDAIRNQDLFQLEHQVMRRDGSIGWTVSRAMPLLNEQSEIVEWFGAARDVTDRKQTETALRNSEAQLSRILDNAGAAIGEFMVYPDRSYRHGFYSAGCEVVYGYSQAEMIGDKQLWLSRVVSDDVETVILPAYEQIFAEASFTIEYRFRDPADNIRWLSESLVSRWDEAAGCWQVTAVTTDISDRKPADRGGPASQPRPGSVAIGRD